MPRPNKGGGRPTKELIQVKTSNIVYDLAELGLTLAEIASSCNTDKQMLYRDFRNEFNAGKAVLTKKLRTAQIDKAIVEKNTTMLIHLGKVYLGQSDFQNEKAAEEKNALDEVDTKDLLALVQSEGTRIPKVIQDNLDEQEAIDGQAQEENDIND